MGLSYYHEFFNLGTMLVSVPIPIVRRKRVRAAPVELHYLVISSLLFILSSPALQGEQYGLQMANSCFVAHIHGPKWTRVIIINTQ
jgi:hypothetical protein